MNKEEEIVDAEFKEVDPKAEWEETQRLLAEGTDEEKKQAYDKLVGAIGNDFISTISVLHHIHKQEKIDQMRMTFDTNEGDTYEIFIVRDREKRLGSAVNEGLNNLFKGEDHKDDEGTKDS